MRENFQQFDQSIKRKVATKLKITDLLAYEAVFPKSTQNFFLRNLNHSYIHFFQKSLQPIGKIIAVVMYL